MSYAIFSYGIDVAEIREALGSKKDDLFHELLQSEMFELYSGQDFEGHTTTEQALADLIYGNPYNKNSAFAYGYAFIVLCSYIGDRLPGQSEIDFLHVSERMDEYLLSDFGVKMKTADLLLTGALPFDLPAVDDFPMSGLLSVAELENLNEQLKHINITQEQVDILIEEDDEKGMAYDGIMAVKSRIAYCYANELELISFCH